MSVAGFAGGGLGGGEPPCGVRLVTAVVLDDRDETRDARRRTGQVRAGFHRVRAADNRVQQIEFAFHLGEDLVGRAAPVAALVPLERGLQVDQVTAAVGGERPVDALVCLRNAG
ncbi:hypothetical protein ACWCPT_16195 [Streptomyces sp. NPDC002308]